MRTVGILLCGLLVAGCLSSTMESWKGEHRDKLIQRWGPPTKEAVLENGGSSLVYSNVWADGFQMQTCRQIFNTDAAGVIRSWAYNGC